MITTYQKSLSKKHLGSLAEKIKILITKNLKTIHTSTIGIIESFDSETQTANIQPAIQFLKYAETAAEYTLTDTNYPLLTNVPVQFPSGGDWHLTFPITKGDECLLIFNERSNGNWRKYGGVRRQNVSTRSHSMMDAIAIVGVKSKPNALTAFNTSEPELRSTDGSTKITLGTTGLSIEGNLTVNGTIDSTGDITSDTEVTAGAIALTTHTHAASGDLLGYQSFLITGLTDVPS